MLDKKYKGTAICISAITLILSPFRMAHASPTISCARLMNFGQLLALCSASITVRATSGSVTNNNGCVDVMGGTVQPGICTIGTTQPTSAVDVRITFNRVNRTIQNTGGQGQITIDQFHLQTQAGSKAASATYPAARIDPTHQFKVGMRLQFGTNDAHGRYRSNVGVVLTTIP
ncbi:MAG: hypothetical protein CBB87_10595 [Micavibrio sp. TMED27]|nr:hypothetical protein [Micavibrio sp.]OUT90201.1 MAG: hypothetical protein CBB87_10595 [Micavibrio sp. TMED27]